MPSKSAALSTTHQQAVERALDRARGPWAQPREVRLRLVDGSERLGRVVLQLETIIVFQPSGFTILGRDALEIPYDTVSVVESRNFFGRRLAAVFAGVGAIVAAALDRSALWLGSPTIRDDFGLPWSERTSLILLISTVISGFLVLALSGSKFGHRWESVSGAPDA